MSNAARRVRDAARDASSTDDLVGEEYEMSADGKLHEPESPHPLDEETLDERASTQMGEMWESVRRDAN